MKPESVRVLLLKGGERITIDAGSLSRVENPDVDGEVWGYRRWWKYREPGSNSPNYYIATDEVIGFGGWA